MYGFVVGRGVGNDCKHPQRCDPTGSAEPPADSARIARRPSIVPRTAARQGPLSPPAGGVRRA